MNELREPILKDALAEALADEIQQACHEIAEASDDIDSAMFHLVSFLKEAVDVYSAAKNFLIGVTSVGGRDFSPPNIEKAVNIEKTIQVYRKKLEQ